jgi:predicted type IV restriction endonuclease
MTCEIDGFKIRCERDLEHAIRKMESAWRRPLSPTAKNLIYNEFHACFQQKTETKAAELSFEEKASGKTLEEIEQDRKRKLLETWKKREKEARIHGYR